MERLSDLLCVAQLGMEIALRSFILNSSQPGNLYLDLQGFPPPAFISSKSREAGWEQPEGCRALFTCLQQCGM